MVQSPHGSVSWIQLVHRGPVTGPSEWTGPDLPLLQIHSHPILWVCLINQYQRNGWGLALELHKTLGPVGRSTTIRIPRLHLHLAAEAQWPIREAGPRPLGAYTDPQHHPPPFLPRLQGLLTLFAEFFASFNHSTCALSVSGLYSALGWIHIPLQTAVPNSSTPGYDRPHHRTTMAHVPPYGALALSRCPFQGYSRCHSRRQHSRPLLSPQH